MSADDYDMDKPFPPGDRLGHYRLDERGEPVRCKTLREWVTHFENAGSRTVKKTKVGAYEVSTVFLALDHNHGGIGPPILWETMIFADAPNSKLHHDMDRCGGGREQAEAMHAAMVERVEQLLKIKA